MHANEVETKGNYKLPEIKTKYDIFLHHHAMFSCKAAVKSNQINQINFI